MDGTPMGSWLDVISTEWRWMSDSNQHPNASAEIGPLNIQANRQGRDERGVGR